MNSALPSVSVVVPSYNRAAVLPHLMDALARQVYPSDKLEVIVVDNSSTDGTKELVDEWATIMPFPIHFVQKANEGPTASRNLGASMARGEILAFTDTDCAPHPTWIRNASRYLAAHADVQIVCGPMVAKHDESRGLFGMQHEQTTHDTGLYPSGNLIFRRRCFEETGGFDEAFGMYPWGALVRGEDTDLVWRAKRAGARAVFLADVSVDHLSGPAPGLRRFLLQPIVVQIIPRLVRSIPELRETFLWRRYFVARDHALFYAGCIAISAAVRTRRPTLLLGLLPWLLDNRRALIVEWRRGGLIATLACAGLLAQHRLMCGFILLFSSVRHRTLVL